MSILVNADEHREEIVKAAHRRAESTFTATYGHKAEINQHARGGGVRTAGSSTNISIGNQRARYGGGAASRPLQRAYTVKLRRRMSPKVAAGAALAGAGAFGVAHHRKDVEKSAAGTAGRAMKRATPMPKKPLVAHPDDAKRGINRYRQNDINREGMTSLRLDEVGKSAAGTAGRAVRDFKRGAQRGIRLAGRGHTHTGQIGSGVAGRPTFSVRSGMPPAGRAGIHAGVLAGNAPTLAAGATVGAGLEHHKVKKSAFGVELAKALGDDNSVRGAVRGNYVPPSASVAPVKKIKLALGPAKSALIAAAKK